MNRTATPEAPPVPVTERAGIEIIDLTAQAPLAPVVPIRDGMTPVARRRLATLLGLLGLALALTLLIGAVGVRAGAERPTDGQVVVGPGQTLWEVTQEHAPEDTDVRAEVDRLRAVNGLTTSTVPAWTVVRLPASWN